MSEDRGARAKRVQERLFGKREAKKEPQLPAEREIADINAAYAFGDVWARETLSMRERSLLTLGILTALYRSDQLRLHVGGALNLGLKPEEILEAIFHAGVYAGMPVSANGRAIANAVFREKGLIKQ